MAQAGDSGDAFEAARRLLAARDADLADADRALAAAVAGAHDIAIGSIGRLEAISAQIEAAIEQPRGTAAGARDVGRHLVAMNREIAEVVAAAKDAVHAKTVALRELAECYRTQ